MDNIENKIKVGDKVTMNTPDDLDWHGRTGTVVQMSQDGSVIKLDGTGQKLMVLNSQLSLSEYFVGQSAGYGGGAMAGGAVAPTNWAGTFSSNQTSRRLNDYPASRKYTYMQGNTVIGSSLYDTITDDDLKHPKFSAEEIMTGLRKEMGRMEYPDKDVAKQTVLKNLETDPKFYSDLKMYFTSDKEGNNIMENIDPKEIEMGTKHEHEHTKDDALARKIAMDHLKEDPKYYSKLKKAGLEQEGAMTPLEAGYVEECCYDSEDDMNGAEFPAGFGAVAPVSKNVAAFIISTPVDAGQEKLTSSGLGKGGNPKTLKTTNIEAPAEKAQVGANKVAVTKTPQIGGVSTCDPLDHFGAQMVEKW